MNKIEKLHSAVLFLLTLLLLPSCRDIEKQLPPSVTFDQESYTVKPNRNLLIKAIVENDEPNAVYSWTMDNRVLGVEKELVFSQESVGDYYVTFTVVTDAGLAKREVKVTVSDLQPPIISLKGESRVILETNEKHTFIPEVENKEDLRFSWIFNNKEVSTDLTYTFSSDKPGTYFLTLNSVNKDGDDSYLIKITVVKEAPLEVSFRYPEQSASLGRSIRLEPQMPSYKNVTFQWLIDGKEVTEKGDKEMLVYTPTKKGVVTVKVVAKKGNKVGMAEVKVKTVDPETTFRPATSSSSPYANKVFEFLPAPGQFINEGYTAFTMEEACRYAEERMNQEAYVSLGGFGGYIVVGFDHSIMNTGGYDFAIKGNSFKGSSEPGIVWVMQDENGNGLPDDNWYELRGSETGKPETAQDYEVTYYRPSLAKANTMWTDNLGNEGFIEWLGFHQQPFYYPTWVKKDTYTLRGTCLAARNFDQSGQGTYWVNQEYDWGYADNFSPIDRLTSDINYNAAPNANHFKISHARTFDGKDIDLKYIDFIKVQTGVNTKSGWLGEVSTEVFKCIDIQIPKK